MVSTLYILVSVKGRLQKWGNSLALRIPKNLADEVRLRQGTEVDLVSTKGRIVIVPSKKDYRIADLLSQITADNIHKETLTGSKKGKEVW